jgi:hypothetical protein
MYSSYSFTTSGLDGGEWPASCPGRAVPQGKDPSTHWTEDLVDLRAGLDTVRGKILLPLPGNKPQSPGPVHSQTLHLLSYSGSIFDIVHI